MDNPEKTLEQVLSMGELALLFGRTNRITFHEDGKTLESDTDHTVMLAMTAGSLADTYLPRLDRGKVVEFALLHDLVEAYAGDVPTFKNLSSDQKKAKDEAEHKALLRIQKQFGDEFPWIHSTIDAYERKDTPEARFVKIIDKMMAKVTHILNDGATLRAMNVTREDADQWLKEQAAWSKEHMKEWPEIKPLWDLLITRAYEIMKKL